MKSKDCDIPAPIKVLGWCLISIIILYLLGKFLGYSDANKFLREHGSLIAGGIAFIAAVIALYSQRESIQTQIEAQRSLEERRLFREKVEVAYNTAEELSFKILLTKTSLIKDVTLDIEIFNYDINKIVMLNRLYEISEEGLFQEYRESVDTLIDAWSNFVSDYILNKDQNLGEYSDPAEVVIKSRELQAKMGNFIDSTNKFLSHLASLKK